MKEIKCGVIFNIKITSCSIFLVIFISNLLFNFILIAHKRDVSNKELSPSKVKDWLSTSGEKGFIENRGQMCDNEGKSVPFVLFKTEAPNINIWITESGMTIQTLVVRKEAIDESEMNDIEKQDSKLMHKPKKRKFMDWERIDLVFKGADIRKENVIKENIDETNFNFFYEHCKDGIYGVKEYQKITIKNIYPNIDWVIYRKKEGEIKYDFVVHPGADFKQIELVYKSKNLINLNQDGQLEFTTKYGDIIEKKPVSFYQNISIATRFKLNYQKQQLINGDNGFECSFSFNFENFNASNTEDLIIDPDLVWSTFYGGNHLDGPTSVDTDQEGNIFVAGYVASSNFPTLNPLGGSYFQGTYGSPGDVMLLKFNNAGQRLWATYYGGSGNDRGWFVTTDVNGNVYVTGDTEGPDFPVLDAGAGAYFQDTVQGQLDLFVLKFNNGGILQFGTCFGGNNLDFGFSISVDNNGNFYVTGQTNSSDLPTLDIGGGSYYQANIGNANAFNSFLIKFNSACILQWSTYYGGSSYETGCGVTNDALGNVFMVGKSESSDFPLLNAGGNSYFQSNGGIGNSNAYVVKFSNTGVRLWATSIGGSLIDEALSVIADDNGDIIVSGKTYSNNFPMMNPGAGAYFQGTFGGVIDIFMARFSNTGTQLWTTYFGGASGENQSWFDNLAVDTCGNIYMTLSSTINDIPLLAQCEGGYLDSLFNGTDVILVKFSNTNKVLWSTFIGGNGLDFQGALAVDHHKNVFVTGEWCGNSVNNATYPIINPGGGSYFDGTFNGGGDDGFILKFAPTIPIINTNIIQPTCANLCAAEATVSIAGSCNYNFLWSNGQTTPIATGLCPGNYTVQITNLSCGGLDTIIDITILAPPNAVTPQFSSITTYCQGSIIPPLPLNSNNNITGTWSPSLNNLVTTIYTFTPDSGQCAIDTALTIQIYPLPLVIASGSNSICESQTLLLNVNAIFNANYIWQGPNNFISTQQIDSITNITIAASGTYVVIVNSNGCSNSDTIQINVLTSTFDNQFIQLCNGQSYQLPDGTFIDTSGVFQSVILNAAGCDSVISSEINLVNAVTTNVTAQVCNGQGYFLPDSTIVFNTGLYSVTLAGSAGCDSIINVNLMAGITSVDSITVQICEGQSYTLPDGSIIDSNGVFTVLLQSQFGCDSLLVTTLNVIQNVIPSVQINALPGNVFCEGTTVLFTGNFNNIGSNPNYQWNLNGTPVIGELNDSLTIVGLQSNDTISLTINSDLNCSDSIITVSNYIVVNVIEIPNYKLHISTNDSILCALQNTTFIANSLYAGSGLIYSWYINSDLVQESADSIFSYNNFSNKDTVTCSIMPSTICTGIAEIYANAIIITVNPNPLIDMVNDEYNQNFGDTIQLMANTNVANAFYNWSANAYLSCSNCSNPYTSAIDTTQYMLTVTDVNTGCFINDSLMIYVYEDFDIFLPTGFSPNGDDVNDIFYLRGRGISAFNLNIFDRWGQLVFTSNDFKNGWDGSYNEKPVLSGTYVYTLSYVNVRKQNKFMKGNLTLIK